MLSIYHYSTTPVPVTLVFPVSWEYRIGSNLATVWLFTNGPCQLTGFKFYSLLCKTERNELYSLIHTSFSLSLTHTHLHTFNQQNNSIAHSLSFFPVYVKQIKTILLFRYWLLISLRIGFFLIGRIWICFFIKGQIWRSYIYLSFYLFIHLSTPFHPPVYAPDAVQH